MRDVLLMYLTTHGLPVTVAKQLLDEGEEVWMALVELLQSTIERNHAATLLAYVQAGVPLIGEERHSDLGMKLLDVAKAMFESALNEAKLDAGVTVTAPDDPDAQASA